MQRPSGTAAVRLSLWMLLFACLAMALVQPTTAGTADAPEIQDPAGDQAVGGTAPTAGQAGTRIDILSVWIDGETATQINVNILSTGAPAGATTATSRWRFHATFDGTEVISVATAEGGATSSPPAPGENVAAVAVDGNTVIMTIDKSVYGAVTSGGVLTNLFVEGQSLVPTANVVYVTDRAPNTGAGTDYTFGGPGGPPACPNCTADDTDGDGLNDTWEQEHFGDLDENATGDPDGDGLTNGQEQALGTDPTKADSDGDGTNDKDDPAPTDPNVGGSSSTTSSSSSSTSRTSSSSSSTSRSSSSNGGTNADDSEGTCADSDTSDAADCLTSDVGYLGMSAGGFLAVLVLCIIALATRWSL